MAETTGRYQQTQRRLEEELAVWTSQLVDAGQPVKIKGVSAGAAVGKGSKRGQPKAQANTGMVEWQQDVELQSDMCVGFFWR
jgi:hypothetical protein